MLYSSDKQSVRRLGSTAITGLVVVVLFVVFVFAVFQFRKPKEAVQDRVGSIADVMTPDPISAAVIAGAIDTESEHATMHPLNSAESIGRARRGEKDDAYHIELTLTLPEIDREIFYYEVWLVQPIPYDFLPIGEMTTDEDGKFILAWQAPDKDADYSGYVQIVITRQEKTGSPDPNVKIAEGEFGK